MGSRSFGAAPLFLLPLLAAGLVLLLGPTHAPYLDLLRQGHDHAARAERTAAVAAYQEAARLRPGDPEPCLRLAQVYLEWGRIGDALGALAEAEQSGRPGRFWNPASSARMERLWVAAHTADADWAAAAEHGRRLLALAPADREARHALARAYTGLKEWEAAQAEYELLLGTDPGDAVAHERLGALTLGEDPAAIQHLFAAGSELAGRLLAALGEPGAAEDPAYAHALVGRALFEEQEWALAAHQFERALAGNPAYPDAHAYLGHVLDQMGRPDEALSHLLRAVELAPDSTVAHTFLGLHYDRLGDTAAARAEYEVAYDLLWPVSERATAALCAEIGQTWAAEGRYVAAEIWLRHAVSLQPDDASLWKALARFYVEQQITGGGRGVEATDKLVELVPEEAEAHDLRGWAAFQVGDYATAREYLLQALALDPALATAHYHLGRLWVAQGLHQEAREAFGRALDLDTSGGLEPLIERALIEQEVSGA